MYVSRKNSAQRVKMFLLNSPTTIARSNPTKVGILVCIMVGFGALIFALAGSVAQLECKNLAAPPEAELGGSEGSPALTDYGDYIPPEFRTSQQDSSVIPKKR